MEPLVTVCIPVAPAHKALLPRAIQSVERQSIDANYIYSVDSEKRGAGYMRNRLLEKVGTPYVVFLDADDWLETQFLEACFEIIDYTWYVYTDWFEGNVVNGVTEGGWRDGSAHVVTCLLHTDMARSVGGFDETMRGMEDTDFFLKLMATGYCGKRVREPLFNYSPNGQRSKAIVESGEIDALQQYIQNKHRATIMSNCCGQNTQTPTTVIGEKKQGDVKAMYINSNPQKVAGAISGRRYGYMYHGFVCWVDPRDIKAHPRMWREMKPLPKPKPKRKSDAPKEFPMLGGNEEQRHGLEALAHQLAQAGVTEDQRPKTLPDIVAEPDFNTFMELVGQAYAD